MSRCGSRYREELAGLSWPGNRTRKQQTPQPVFEGIEVACLAPVLRLSDPHARALAITLLTPDPSTPFPLLLSALSDGDPLVREAGLKYVMIWSGHER